jgi:hypothetical protein
MTGYEIVEYVRDNLGKSNIEILKELEISEVKTGTKEETIKLIIQSINELSNSEIVELFELIRKSTIRKQLYVMVAEEFTFRSLQNAHTLVSELSNVKVYIKDELISKIILSVFISNKSKIALLTNFGCNKKCMIEHIVLSCYADRIDLLNTISGDKNFKHEVLLFLNDNSLEFAYDELCKYGYFNGVGLEGINNSAFTKHCGFIGKIRYYFDS